MNDEYIVGAIYSYIGNSFGNFFKEQGKHFIYIGETDDPYLLPFKSIKTGDKCYPGRIDIILNKEYMKAKEFEADLKDLIEDKNFYIEDLCGNAIIVTEEQYNAIEEAAKRLNKKEKENKDENNENP